MISLFYQAFDWKLQMLLFSDWGITTMTPPNSGLGIGIDWQRFMWDSSRLFWEMLTSWCLFRRGKHDPYDMFDLMIGDPEFGNQQVNNIKAAWWVSGCMNFAENQGWGNCFFSLMLMVIFCRTVWILIRKWATRWGLSTTKLIATSLRLRR